MELKELEVKKRVEGEERKRLEGDLLLDAIPAGAFVVALDERGKSMASKEFAKLLADKRDQGLADMVFIIGGADVVPQHQIGCLTLLRGLEVFPVDCGSLVHMLRCEVGGKGKR